MLQKVNSPRPTPTSHSAWLIAGAFEVALLAILALYAAPNFEVALLILTAICTVLFAALVIHSVKHLTT